MDFVSRTLVGLKVILISLIYISFSGQVAFSDIIKDTIVSVKCKTGEDGVTREGTGIVISEDGMVLTAKHVVFGVATSFGSDISCQGSLGNSRLGTDSLEFQKASSDLDAVILRYPSMSGAPFLKYCNVENRLLRSQIVATGFPRNSRTGEPSSRVGVISTTKPDQFGFIETDTATTRGMSGGMVTLSENNKLIGIVSGVEPDPTTGLPKFFAVLAAQRLADDFASFGLTLDQEGCLPRNRLSKVIGELENGEPWEVQDGDLKLGLKEGEGLCYLVQIWGDLDDSSDFVAVKLDDDREFVLTGKNGGGGRHGGYAQCLNF